MSTRVMHGQASAREIDAHVAIRAREVFLPRARIGISMSLTSAALMAAFTLIFGAPTGGFTPILYIAPSAVLLFCLFLVTRPQPSSSIIEICCAAVVCLCFISCAWASIEGRTTELQVLVVGLALACTALLPWGTKHQACVATAAMAATMLNLRSSGGGTDSWGATAVLPTVAILLAVSVYGSRELESSRRHAAVHELGLARARSELLAVNAELDLEQVDLTAVAQAVAADLEAGPSGRTVEWHIEPGMKVLADRGLLSDAMTNLMSNAWKFTAGCDVARIAIGRAREEIEPTFFVHDNGVGFNMEHVDQLFQPFQRLHHQDEFEGSGIGLATVKRIVQRHGGKIWARGAIDEGAEFRFTLPVQT